MDEINKKEVSEADIYDLFITPAIEEAGWDPLQQIGCEVTLSQKLELHYEKVTIKVLTELKYKKLESTIRVSS